MLGTDNIKIYGTACMSACRSPEMQLLRPEARVVLEHMHLETSYE